MTHQEDVESALRVIADMPEDYERDRALDNDGSPQREAVTAITQSVRNLQAANTPLPAASGDLSASRAARAARILGDLDRCRHGRHRGDPCAGWDPTRPGSGCAGGYSHGNPWLVPGQPIGYDRFGRVYVVPADGETCMYPTCWIGNGQLPPGYVHPDDNPDQRLGVDTALAQRAQEYLRLCPAHDAGYPGDCTCPTQDDARSLVLALVRALEQALGDRLLDDGEKGASNL